jgi:hypothetical protein
MAINMGNDSDRIQGVYERQARIRMFKGAVRRKVLASPEFTPEEKDAIRYVSDMVGGMADSWRQTGRGRAENVGRDALYLRKYRANLALENAKKFGAARGVIAELRVALEEADREYEAWKRQNRKRAKSNGKP